MTPKLQPLAILFADIAGSSGLYQNYGDEQALTAIEGCLAVLRAAAAVYHGRVVKTIGDELMVVFPSADEAFCAAFEMQWRVVDLPACGADKLAVRIGFHYGQTIEQDGDVFGDSVNIAARLVRLAKPGQILTSARTMAAVDRVHAAHARKLNNFKLRGMEHEETLYEGLWHDNENITAFISGVLPQSLGSGRLVLRYGDVATGVGAECQGLTLGRDPASDVVVTSRRASRMHARIERRRDKFILIDQSSNGTFITDENGHETVLRLEEMALHGRGLVSFGEPVVAGGAGLLEFICEDEVQAVQATGPVLKQANGG
jgi:adenylate cyclase